MVANGILVVILCVSFLPGKIMRCVWCSVVCCVNSMV